ncbi:ankyrin repeat-containing domain protein [Mycena latifolia]|nr:ankyrin repeat-containing domain protein [Mycena latifolia]
MADPIGLVGLVASVLQLVNTVAQIRGYIKDFRDAPEDQRQLLLEIESLESLVVELEERIKSNQATGMTSGLQQFERPLIQLKGTMERLTKKLDSTGISKVSHRVVWPLWGKEDIEEGLSTIERFKSLLNAWLGMDIWKSGQDIASSIQDFTEEQRTDHGYIMRSVKDLAQEHRAAHDQTISTLKDATEEQRTEHIYIAKSIRDVARTQERYHDSDQRQKILDWYSPLNFFLRQADIFSAWQPGTGAWLLEASLFKEWKSGGGKILWCRGIPGAGKTVLASIVVENLRTEQNTGVAVLYLNHKETETPSNLLAALWRQLVSGKPIPPAVHHLYAKHHEQRTRPSLQDTYSTLCSIISAHPSIFIVVDALDEYPEELRNILLSHLSALGPTVNLMLTSRPHIKIEHVLVNSALETLEIRATDDDIRRHITAQIAKSSRLSNHVKNCLGLRDEIESVIVRRSDGMFLLTKFHIDSLTTKPTVKAVRNALKNMPDDLNSTYDEVVDRINRQSEDDKALAWRTLSWITNVKRPLRPAELREALAVEQGTKKLDRDNILDMDTILSVCTGLVVINEADKRLRLIHHTTQSYLDHVQSSVFPQAQMEITTTCITYLSFDTFWQNPRDPMSLFHQNSFLDYAVEYCLIHARGEPEVYIKQSILSFLADCGPWWQLWNWKQTRQPKSNTKLSIASRFHLKEICRDLIQEGGDGRRQIYEAALDGLTDIVKLLIAHGVDINAEWSDGTPLYIASRSGHYDVVRLLIEHGADVNAQGGWFGSALQAASWGNYKDTVSLLIEHGADIDLAGGGYGSALQAASSLGHTNIVYLLIEHGADVDAQGGRHGSALHAASSAGHKDIVSLLIEHGANVNAQGTWYGSALHAASAKGRITIISLLVEHGADVNAKSRWDGGGSALHAASSAGRKDIVSLLIEHGADVNAEGTWYGRALERGSALQAASSLGHTNIVHLLIEHGADVNAKSRWDDGGSALHAASSAGHKDIVSLLIEHGADVNAEGTWCGRALQLERGCGSALQAASSLGHTNIVHLLIEHGADVNAGLHSALHAAASAGHKDIISRLIERDPDVNAQRTCQVVTLQGVCQCPECQSVDCIYRRRPGNRRKRRRTPSPSDLRPRRIPRPSVSCLPPVLRWMSVEPDHESTRCQSVINRKPQEAVGSYREICWTMVDED